MSADVTVLEYPSHKRKETESTGIETVVIEDNEILQINRNNNNNKVEEVVEILSDDDDEIQICEDTSLFEEILKKGGLFADVIEKCLELEHSDGMERIVKKTLMRYYRMANKTFLESSVFNKDLLKTLQLLDSDPNHKFTYIKRLCDSFKSSLHKKRVNLITLETNLKERQSKKRNSDVIEINKRRKVDVIEIDDVDNEVLEVINLDEDQTDTQINIIEGEKENEALTNAQDHKQDHLTPQKVYPYTHEPTLPTISRDEVISVLESRITKLHKEIKVYEEQEVTDDTEWGSPYMRCERLKSSVVKSYKELCELTGSLDRKPKLIKLNVTEGHPRGPTQLLEALVNERMEGEIFNFPDMMDVVKCVVEGLKFDGLHWTKSQIMKEAVSLFVQCGRALQKSRQRREWKHLLYHMKKEQTQDDDPAARDPELMAKLELNRMIAEQKESKLINKYVELQDSSARKWVTIASTNQILQAEEVVNEYAYQDCVSTISAKTNINYVNGRTEEVNIGSNQFESTVDRPNIHIIENGQSNFSTISADEEKNQHLVHNDASGNHSKIKITNCQGYLEISVDSIAENQGVAQSCDYEENINSQNLVNNTYPEVLDKDTPTTTVNEHESTSISNKTYPEVLQNVENTPMTTVNGNTLMENTSITKEVEDNFNFKVKVKTEPTERIANLLESLGDNYTVSIVDIEDPFLIIEISSDSDTDDE